MIQSTFTLVEQRQDTTLVVIAMAFILASLFVGFIAILASAKRRHDAQYQEGVHDHQETAIRLAIATEEKETESLVIPQPHVGLGTVLARWLMWMATERRKHPKRGRSMQRTRHFADLRIPTMVQEDENEGEESEPEGEMKQLPAPAVSYVNPLAGKSYNLPGLLEQGERVFLIALKGFIWNIHELYIMNGRKVTRDGFVLDPKKDPVVLQNLKLTKVEWDYLIGPIKATPEGKEPGILRQSGTITIDENNGLAIWPFESAEAAYLHVSEWLAAYMDDEREEKEGSFR